jgi:hypothetical protein
MRFANVAAKLSNDDVTKVLTKLTSASLMMGMNKDALAARKSCTEAQAIVEKFDLDTYVTAQIEECFAKADHLQKNVAAACQHYRNAAENYDKVRSNPKSSVFGGSRSVDTKLKDIGEAYSGLKCSGAIPAADTAKMARPPNVSEINEVMALTLRVKLRSDSYNDLPSAKQTCDDARVYAARFDPDSYVAGMIDSCYGYYEEARKNQAAACSYFTKAAKEFEAVPTDYVAFKNVAFYLKDTRDRRAKLGC